MIKRNRDLDRKNGNVLVRGQHFNYGNYKLQWQAQKLQKSRILLIFNCNSLHTKGGSLLQAKRRKNIKKERSGEPEHLLSLIMLLIAPTCPSILARRFPSVILAI